LLRLSQTLDGLPPGRFTATDIERLVARLATIGLPPESSRPTVPRPSAVGTAADEFEALLRKLSPLPPARKPGERVPAKRDASTARGNPR
jgi:hypothetical protein